MQWRQPGSPSTEKLKRVSSEGKVMVSIFWDSQNIIMVNYFEEGRTVNGTYYADELRRLRQEIVKKKLEVFCSYKIMHQPLPLYGCCD